MTVTNQELANAIRSLAIDAIEQSKSGHPGLPLGIADVATILYKDFLNFSSQHPNWENRDRFILSAGHGSMLVYALLYLTGYQDITIDDIKNFRQLGQKTAGHPEYGHISGIETTTGPLGQGLANAVGMAFAEKMLKERFPDFVDHYTYVIAGDGCLMEGISQESISFAAHYKLHKLILLFDDNSISIDGDTNVATSEDQAKRFAACGWNVLKIDGHNHQEIHQAITQAKNSDKPTIICCKTVIGFGSPNKSGSASVHGSPLGAAEAKLTKEQLNCVGEAFTIPKNILAKWREIGIKNNDKIIKWQENFANSDALLKAEFNRLMSRKLPDNWHDAILKLKKEIFTQKPSQATRQSSGAVLELLTKEIPELIGGSADLTGSNNTKTTHTKSITNQDFSGRYIHYGIREHAMGAIMNGIALHKGFIPYSGTFLVFSDYCKPAIRMSALMQQKVIYVMTHDSIGLGEDGPTHQPIEHLESMRSIPNLLVLRPCDIYETLECWQIALTSKQPVLMSLTRQKLNFSVNEYHDENLTNKGAYIISKEEKSLQATIIATGSEVEIALKAQEILLQEDISVRVVSMPCVELFEQQDIKYQQDILGNTANIIAVEAAYSPIFYKYAKKLIGIESFGASGKYQDLYEYFGINTDNIIKTVKKMIHEN